MLMLTTQCVEQVGGVLGLAEDLARPLSAALVNESVHAGNCKRFSLQWKWKQS